MNAINKYFDYVARVTNKLIYRVLKWSGASENALNNWNKAVYSNFEEVKQSDKAINEAGRPRLWYKILIFTALIAIGTFIVLKIKKIKK